MIPELRSREQKRLDREYCMVLTIAIVFTIGAIVFLAVSLIELTR